ncbi:beta-ketoacyl synthase N-terminal-like domain-containing protein [Micromonospora sp. URMC 105]|uniref:beta-ketoacyl synthase N-terminal-like domain-containing protein n=1 Tax=Micromonospora sp. URMC 105 TaxID=3423413 RepID=UPI003F1DE0F6
MAIVGMGAVFPGAGDVPTFWRNILNGVDAIADVPPSRWDPQLFYDPRSYHGPPAADRFYCRRGGFVDEVASFDPIRFGIMPAAVPATDPDQLLALRAAAEAIDDAGGLERLPDPGRIGVIVGRGGYLTPGMARLDQRVRTVTQLLATLRDLFPHFPADQLDQVRTTFLQRLGPAQPDAAVGLVPNFAASRIANRFDLRGPAYTLDAACASGLVAVDAAIRELHAGRCDAVLAGAVHVCHDPTLWSVFTQLRALSPSERIRPFDRRADGTLMAEGTGVMVLKRLADADADRVYAVVRGVGVASDGSGGSLVSPAADGQVLALRRAWQAAGLDPRRADAVGLIEAHGTATPVGDAVELHTLARVFGTPQDGPPIPLGTVKSMIGHAMPAAGAAGLIKAALALHHRVLPSTLHVEQPHPGFAATRCRPLGLATDWGHGDGPRRAAVNAFGFGGINAHVVLEEPPTAPAVDLPPRSVAASPAGTDDAGEPVLLLAGENPDAIARALDAPDGFLLDRAARGIDLLRAGTDPTAWPPACRLAIVGPTPRRLALARAVVKRDRAWRGREDVWFTPDPLLPAEGGVAFLFPGFEPGFAPRVDDIADHLGLPRPTLTGGDDLYSRSADVLAVGRLLADALAVLGLRPDLVTGHSLGEWTAMVVAGCFPRDAVDAFLASLRPGTVSVPDVVYAAVGCAADRAAAVADAGVVVSHDNCPHQAVLCGPPEGITEALRRLRADGVPGEVLPFRSGFHTPAAARYLAAVRASFDVLPVTRPHVPVWSATTLAPYPDRPEQVRDLIIKHLLEPVRFRGLVERLHQVGVRAYVQVGPGSLTGFVTDTLGRREHLATAAQASGRSGLAQLRRVLAALWVEGRQPRWDRLPTPGGGSGASSASQTLALMTTDTGGAGPRAPRAAVGPPVPLALGAPMVRLDETAPFPPRPATSGPIERPGPAGTDPVLAELDALLAEAGGAARLVADAWRTAPVAPQGGAGTAGVPQPPAPAWRRAPAPAGPGSTAVTAVECSLAAMPHLLDHSLIPQPAEWAEPDDRFPVVPMTGLLELMADAARHVLPGRAVTGFEQVRAMRWLAVSPPTTVTVRAVVDGVDRVRVSIEGYAGGTVLFADAYPPAPTGEGPQLRDERPAPVTAEALYGDGWMFHGPAFAGVTHIHGVAEDGIRGTLTALPAPGALLDAAGQLIGHWMQVSADTDQVVFPTGIEQVRWHGPPPAVGERLDCVARVTELTAERMRADLRLTDRAGRPRVTLIGWDTHRFSTDDVMWRLKQHPGTVGAAEPQSGGWCLVRERWPDTATRELVMRRYLGAAERAEYARLSPPARRQWLLGRVAVKDAVRTDLWRVGAGDLYPVQVVVNGTGVRARGPGGESYSVSLAHAGAVAVAIAVPEGGPAVGIDLAPVLARDDATVTAALTRDEWELLHRLAGVGEHDRAEWLTRLLTAKRAVGTALGTGVDGTAGQPVVTAVDRDGGVVSSGPDRQYRVRQRCLDVAGQTYVVAWTEVDNQGEDVCPRIGVATRGCLPN